MPSNSSQVADLDSLEEKISTYCQSHALVLYGIRWTHEHQQNTLQVILENDQGIGPDSEQLGMLSQDISRLLDVYLPTAAAYRLEITGPGLDRVLWKKNHFARFQGCAIHLYVKQNMKKKWLDGQLLLVNEHGIDLQQIEHLLHFPWEQVVRAKLHDMSLPQKNNQ